jgi:activator of HSP90 ATPase
MAKTIVQKVLFKKTSPKALYDLYMNAKLHSAATGAVAKISEKEGTHYSAHDGYIKGRNLQLIKNRLIVQSWRASDWDKSAIDSTFTIHLEAKGEDVVLHMVHANLPDHDASHINKGWNDHYWKPWKKFLAGKPISKPKM